MLLFLADVGFRVHKNTPLESVVTKAEALPPQVPAESIVKPAEPIVQVLNKLSYSKGDIDNIVSFAEDRDGFLVNGCGDRCYLQLYYNSRADQFYGNYYEIIKGS